MTHPKLAAALLTALALAVLLAPGLAQARTHHRHHYHGYPYGLPYDDQLPAQLRARTPARHLRLLRRSGDQFLLAGVGDLYRPGPPQVSLLLNGSGSTRWSLDVA